MLITSEYVSARRRKDKNNNYNEYANHDKDYQKKLPLGGMGGLSPYSPLRFLRNKEEFRIIGHEEH